MSLGVIVLIQLFVIGTIIVCGVIYAETHKGERRSQSQLLDDTRNSMMQSSLDRAANAAEKTAQIAIIERTDNTSRRWTSYK